MNLKELATEALLKPSPGDYYALVYDRARGNWLQFRDPLECIEVDDVAEVVPAIHRIEERLREKRLHAAGFISYEAASAFDSAFCTKTRRGGLPLLSFGLFAPPQPVCMDERMNGESGGLQWAPTVSREEHERCVSRIKELIGDGETYQVNYTYRLNSDFDIDPFSFFCAIAGDDPPPHSCFFQTARWAICSFSPELFFEVKGNTIRSRPMKGTHIRGRTTEEDDLFAEALHHSQKNRAENIMIVDMVRNDIGRVAEVGTVQTEDLFSVERFPTLLQMTSQVSAKTEASFADIFTALFPCASITGAPKIQTMKIIEELETQPRGIYTGTIGYIAPDRNASFNVAIRTLLVDKEAGKAEYGTGGGIVWDSAADDEYDESQQKARILFEPPRRFSLFETLLWTPGDGFFLLDSHLDRLRASSRYFGFKTDPIKIKRYLQDISQGFSGIPQRVHLEVDRHGYITHQAAPFPERTSTAVRLAFSRTPVNSQDRMLYHKTSLRHTYDSALQPAKGNDDLLLRNERGEITETTIANIVLDIDNRLLTPPVFSGLLPGVMRKHLLESGKIAERVLTKEDVVRAKGIFRINSVRKWEACTLVDTEGGSQNSD